MLKIEPILQKTNSDCGKACAIMVLQYYGVQLRGMDSLANVIDGVQVRTLEAFFREKGFSCASGNFTNKLLEHFVLKKVPVICLLDGHYVVVTNVKNNRVTYNCPIEGQKTRTMHQFYKQWKCCSEDSMLIRWAIAIF